ncbi:MAG: helix-turn-helix transcriptional regulator [Flavobacteriales bacterium]|nr:helix-turn-helix transcriptional regulator [Flavobacteriales bacterium]
MFVAFVQEEQLAYDVYFVSEKEYITHQDFYASRRGQTMVISHEARGENILCVRSSQEEMIEKIERFLEGNRAALTSLTDREIQVLKMIARGAINKEIAAALSISFNTVLTHRKNITAKLGIKTVSGLTFYAMMNGYVSPSDIDV